MDLLEKKLERLRKIREALLEETGTTAGVVIVDTPGEITELAGLPETEPEPPAPGYIIPLPEPRSPEIAPLSESNLADSPVEPEFSEEELRYLTHGDLLTIYAENPMEIPERIRARCARLVDSRREPLPSMWW